MADKVKGVKIDPVREKLMELMFEGQVLADAYCDKQDECDKCPHNAPNGCRWGAIADHLIANGVTVQEWISVTDRLPEKDGLYLCNYHFGKNRDMTFTRVLDYYATDKIPHFQHTLGDTTMKVTHWMPLPEPPKGE